MWWKSKSPFLDGSKFRDFAFDFHSTGAAGSQSATMDQLGDSVVQRELRLAQYASQVFSNLAVNRLVFEFDFGQGTAHDF